ncbi:DNA-binding MarR family transcriptional regulator [Paenarthrobacter nicotinovorans]|uniref:MarR family winged helix-turn-helix transcriptional regulator n=1 Tax=Micrococcaceae TaxID=1268 RepID=UPI0008774E6F|nr:MULTISPECIES: MarR family transcriptional regulator [Micrococcaceae]MDR6436614.1 DNA-binding MarR family transcriptional regulator [Paenarthrobacter nicotinovorans]SCZ57137.1 DNA-binding transcriptional regulator, MarR family [Arthrobacter sp. UNCCL28]
MVESDRESALKSIDALAIAITIRSIPRILQPLLTTDLTIQQLKVLSVVVTTESGATGVGLAETFGVSMASMSKLVDRLAAAGLVARSTDTDDQRVRRISATDLGRSVVRELMAARPELGGEVLAGLTLEELKALETGLRAVGRELREAKNPENAGLETLR